MNFKAKRFIAISSLLVIVAIILFISYKRNKPVIDYGEIISKKYIDEHDIVGALGLVNEALSIYPKNTAFYVMRASIYYENKQFNEAFKDTERVVSLGGYNYPDLYLLRGELLSIQDNFIQSAEEYRKAYDLNPSDIDIIKDYSRSLNLIGKSEEAYGVLKDFEDKSSKDSYFEDVDFWIEKAYAELNTGRCAEAGASAYHVIMRTKEGKDAYELARSMLYKSGQKSDCVESGANSK